MIVKEETKKSSKTTLCPLGKGSIVISNLTDRYFLHYGQDFGGMLDARDQVMEHQFDLAIDFKGENMIKGG